MESAHAGRSVDWRKRAVKMKRIGGPAALTGSRPGSPGEKETESAVSGLAEEPCVTGSRPSFPFPLEKVCIFCRAFRESVPSPDQDTLRCTRAHKHGDVCTLLRPRYIIISTLPTRER